MSKKLPLFRPDQLTATIQKVAPLAPDSKCTACLLHQQAVHVCTPARGEAGSDGARSGPLLVIGEYPTRAEEQSKALFASSSNHIVRQLVRRYWSGPVVWDNAVRCAPRKEKLKPAHIDACRPYLADTIACAEPSRILLFGSAAYRSVLGRAPAPMSVRRGWSWLVTPATPKTPETRIPVYFMLPPLIAAQNRFLREWMEGDIEAACTDAPPPRPPWDASTRVVETAQDAQAALAEARAHEWVSWDVETVGEMFNQDFRVISVAIAFKGSIESWVWGAEALADPAMRGPLATILADPDIALIGQNAKYDAKACALLFGSIPTPIKHDTRLYRKLMNTEAAADLETMGELIGMGGHKEEAQAHLGAAVKALRQARNDTNKALRKNPDSTLDASQERALRVGSSPLTYAYGMIDKDVLHRYNARDAVVTSLLGEMLEQQLLLDAPPSLASIWDDVLQGATEAFAQIEIWGMPFSTSAAQAFVQYLDMGIADSEKTLNQYANINYNSTKEVAGLLFGTLGLKSVKETPGGAKSTDADSLEGLRGAHPVVDAILENRKLHKMRGTYALGMLQAVRADGRIHTNYNLDGARSGRLSSDAPNLQNLPRAESAVGKMARDMFATEMGWVLVQLDYSQLELRIAADLSGDPKMLQIFSTGDDYHQRTAELVARKAWGIEPSQVVKKHRSAAKVINFRTLYGGGDKANAKEIGCSVREARAIREAIFGEFVVLAEWIETCRRDGRRHGEAWTYWRGQPARRRALFDVASPVEGIQITAENSTWNTPIQGTASEYCLASIVALVEWLRATGFQAKLTGTVHDSIMFEVRRKDVDALVAKAKSVMEGWPTKNGVRIAVDAEVGRSWGSLVAYEPGWETRVYG